METPEAHGLSTQGKAEVTVPVRPAGTLEAATASDPAEPAATLRCVESGKKHRQDSNGSNWTSSASSEGVACQHRQQEGPPPPEAAITAPEVPRGHCHGRHSYQLHRRCCCGSHCGASQRVRGSSSNNNTTTGSGGTVRRRCGCRIGEYIFFLIPRKPLSPGAAFLFSLLEEASPRFRCAVDMGGTLAKLVFIEELGPQRAAAAAEAVAAAAAVAAGDTGFVRRDPQLAARVYAGTCDAALDLASPLLTIRASPRRVLRFTYFRTKAINALLDCLRSRDLLTGGVLRVTGGGAMKYAGLFKEQLGVSIQRTDEMDSIMAGLVLLASHTNSVFRFDLATRQRIPVDVSLDPYPFLVVNIGSGVSILKAKSASSFVRVTGTCIGGGTVLGLARLLFHAKSFRQVVRLSERGTDALDLRVADLCGDAAGSRCIAPHALASSFGRLYLEDNPERPRPRKEDIARSLIHMVSYNLGYLAYLVGTAHGVRRIFFAGKFINNYDFTMESITQGVNFYMQQYDQHTPQSFLRPPASPLLAAPPDFNVNAQQQVLLQQQLLMQQQLQQHQQHVDVQAPPAAAPVPVRVNGDMEALQQQEKPLLDPTSSAQTATKAVPWASHGAPVATVQQVVATADGDVSPISMPSRPQPRNLTPEQHHQQKQPQQQQPPGLPPKSPSCLPYTSSSLPSPAAAQPENASAVSSSCWAPFEVLFLRHDGYLGAIGALVAPGREGPPPQT